MSEYRSLFITHDATMQLVREACSLPLDGFAARLRYLLELIRDGLL